MFNKNYKPPLVSTAKNQSDLAIDSKTPADRRSTLERRSPTLKGFLIGCIKCRRRSRRRADCKAHFPADWYDTKLFVMALSLLLLSITDAAMTMTLLNNGAVEINPFMNFLLNQSTNTFIYTKLALTAICILVLVAYYHSKLFNSVSVDMLLTFSLTIYSALVIYELFLYFSLTAS